MERQGGGNDFELNAAALGLDPINDVIQVEDEVASAVFALNEPKCVNVVVVPRGGIEVCFGQNVRSH